MNADINMNADILKRLGLQLKEPTGDTPQSMPERFRQSYGLAPTVSPRISSLRVAEINELYGPGRSAEQLKEMIQEENEIMEIGSRIGFGRLMQAARDTWADAARQNADKEGREATGSHFTIGPCASMVVPCECDRSVSPCYWCCGAGWLTSKVKQAKDFLDGVDLNNKQEF